MPLLVAGVALGGCAHAAPPLAGRPEQPRPSAPRESPTVVVSLAERPPTDACVFDPIYFDFDSFILDDRARDTVTGVVACYMNTALPKELVLTGAADPRGTEEYNLALGLRRAASVRSYLSSLGIPPFLMTTSSSGEELATGKDEEGYRRDRHVLATAR